jgi:hypothetical protein
MGIYAVPVEVKYSAEMPLWPRAQLPGMRWLEPIDDLSRQINARGLPSRRPVGRIRISRLWSARPPDPPHVGPCSPLGLSQSGRACLTPAEYSAPNRRTLAPSRCAASASRRDAMAAEKTSAGWLRSQTVNGADLGRLNHSVFQPTAGGDV